MKKKYQSFYCDLQRFLFLSLRKTSLQYRAVIQSCVLKIKEKLSKFINILDFFGNFFLFEIIFIFNSQLITIIVTNKMNIKSKLTFLDFRECK